MVLLHQRHRQTDGQTTCDRKTALCTIVHHAVKSVGICMQQSKASFCQVRSSNCGKGLYLKPGSWVASSYCVKCLELLPKNKTRTPATTRRTSQRIYTYNRFRYSLCDR